MHALGGFILESTYVLPQPTVVDRKHLRPSKAGEKKIRLKWYGLSPVELPTPSYLLPNYNTLISTDNPDRKVLKT